MARIIKARAQLARSSAKNASKHLLHAVQTDENARTLHLLSVAFKRQENPTEALNWARKAAEPAQNHAAANWCGQCALEDGQYPMEAEEWFHRAIELAPPMPAYRNSLGLAFRGQGQLGDAVRCFEIAVELDPKAPGFRTNLTEALISENDLNSALASARKLVELRPNDAAAHLLCAECLIGENQAEEAEKEARRATELRSFDSCGFASLASILLALGRIEDARSQCQRSLDLEPRQGLAHFNLIRSRRTTEDDLPTVKRMAELMEDPNLPIGQKTLLGFGLGKAHQDLGEFEESMRWYDEANLADHRSKFGTEQCDMELNPPPPCSAAYEAVKKRYDKEFFEKNPDFGNPSEAPIFVFGMMRSGTTLMEQILSRHPLVGASGEQLFWAKNRWAPFEVDGNPDKGTIDRLTEDYLAILSRIAPGSRFVVDKMPMNYMHVGLLQLALPNAKMIHMRRHPIDTCLSVYTTQNRVPIPWANDKENIAVNYHRRYLDLMDHWRSALTHGRIIEVQYEELVDDPEPVIQRVLAACGLDWDEACLHPEENERCVATPSNWQVRQPIYKSSVAKWKQFEPWLGGLAGLQEDAEAR